MDILQSYKQEMKNARFVESLPQNFSSFFGGVYMEMNENFGTGFSEILSVRSGLLVERNNYAVYQDICSHHADMTSLGFRLGIMLSGDVDMEISGKSYWDIVPGMLWCGWGNSGPCDFKQFSGEKISSVVVELPDDFVASWLGSSGCPESRQLEKLINLRENSSSRGGGYQVLASNLGKTTGCMRLAEQIVAAKGSTLAESLHYESLALEFLSSILTLNDTEAENYPKLGKALVGSVDDAIDILRQEFIDPPSISALARRVGINECYLKKGFREKTGETIGGYIRYLRMQKAQELLESGNYSVLDTAVFVGYSNPGHFSMAFKKMYGHSPSAFLPRLSRM